MGSALRLSAGYEFGVTVRDRDCDCCGRLIEGGETHVVGTNADGSQVHLAVDCALSHGLAEAEA